MKHCMHLRLPLWWLVATTALAQAPQIRPVISPEILPDRRVTFRVNAPKANEVSVWGDWMAPNTPVPMVQDHGLWSLTVGPLDPGLAIYTVTTDGVTTPDPVNPRIKLRARTAASLVDVPGTPPELWQARDVPHGAIAIHWAASQVTGDTRSFQVYTPPGYDSRRSRRYPVLYLLHGSNDTAAGWTDVGKANFILDNLIAEKRATPMIVVMPWGHAVPFDGPQARNNTTYERYLLTEVAPFVERNYRVASGRANRAIVGLSMGGGQALEIGVGHLDRFSAVGAFSSAIPGDFATRFLPELERPNAAGRRLELLWIGCGRQDGAFERNQELAELLARHQVPHTFQATDGRHNFALWRRYLTEVVPLLFRPPHRD